MTRFTGPPRRLSERDFGRALRRMQEPGATLVLEYQNNSTTYRVFPGAWPIPPKIARQLIAHRNVRGCGDGLFPECHQTWAWQGQRGTRQ
jgi:hypothetical protein